MLEALVGAAGVILGAVVGFFVWKTIAASNTQSLEVRAKRLLVEAEQEAADTRRQALVDARADAAAARKETDEDLKLRRDEVARLERRITQSEEEAPPPGPEAGRASP